MFSPASTSILAVLVDTSVPVVADSKVKYPLRRDDVFPCACGTCFSCCDDLLFWNVVKAHRVRREQVLNESTGRYAHNPEKYPLESIPECSCVFCVRAGINEIPADLSPLQKASGTHLRRRNNCECVCMICATCVSDAVYFNVVTAHASHIAWMQSEKPKSDQYSSMEFSDCDCLYCCTEREFHTRMRQK